MNKCKNVWVYIELNEKGIPENVGLELLNPAKNIAKDLNEELLAVIIGDKVDYAIEELKNYGVDNVIVISNELFKEYNTEAYTIALNSLCEEYKPNTILIGATTNGRDLAPRLASSLNAGLTADCTELSVDIENKNVLWSRPTFGGNLMAVIIAPNARPQIGTIRPNVFKKIKYPKNDSINIINKTIKIDHSKIRTKIIDKIFIKSEEVNFENKDIVIGVGRGIESQKNLKLIEELANLLNASIACSRNVVDSAWLPHSNQVGQSGKTISPKIYIAIGISGAIQHLSGISSSETIIAINKDPNANIFTVADYGIVGDLFEIVPKLIEEIKSKG